MDTRIRLIAEDLTKDAVLALEKLSLLTNELIKNTEQLRIANERKANAEKKEVQETIGIINNLNEKIRLTTKLRNESNDISQINQYNRELSKQESELKKLTDTQQKSNILSKEQNSQIQALTANAGQSNSMFRNLAATMIGLFAVDRILEYSKNLLDTAVNSQRLDIALKNVSGSNAEYSKSIEYLNDISNKYGQNVNNLKESYIQFIASTKTSNLALSERQRIFESIVQSGSTLQLSNTQIERSLNAVNQMFSKSTVSAEELRQQMGENLPGSFSIMAKALNVSEKQLNKMLEQGEVLAKDALPKFAAVLTEMYGDKAQNNVNTWAGGLNRATNSLTAWVNKTNESLGITEKMAKSANWVADNFGKLTSAIGGVSAALAVYTLRKVASNTIDQIKLINLGREVLAKQAVAGATIELTAAETAAAAAATKFNATVASAPYGLALLAISALVTMLLQYNQAQQEAYERTEEGIKATDQSIKAEKAHGIELATNVEQIKKLAYGNEERIARVKDLMRIYPQYFKDMTAEQVSNWHLTNMYRGVNAEIERKITLMAREKSVQKNTERLAEIKMELEARGVLAKSVQEYYKNEEEKGNWFNTNNLKNTSLLREQTKIYKELETGTYKLRDAQIQMFNQEARNNKAKLEAGIISKEEFKAEVMRIQEVYNVKVQNYKLETNLITSGVDLEKKANKEKSESKKTQLEKDQEENQKAWASFLKTLTKAMKDADDIMRKPFDEQYKRLVKQSKDEKDAADKTIEAKRESLAEGLKLQAYYDMLGKIENAKTLKEIENAENEYSDKILKIDTDLLKEKIKNKKQELLLKKSSGALELADEEKLKEEIAKLEKELTGIKRKEGETQIKNKKDDLKTSEDIEKENIGNRKRMWEGLLNTHISDTALASGKIKDIFKSINIGEFFANNLDEISNLLAGAQEKLDKIIAETTDNTKKFNAQMAKEMIKPWEENVNAAKALLSGDLVGAAKGLWGYVKGMWDMTFGLKKTMSDIKHDDFQTWYQENVKVLDDFQDKISSTFGDLAKQSIIASENIDNSIEGRINAEIKVGEQIKANYEVAVNAENKLYQTKIDNINKEYALKEIKALSEFGAASLSIKEKMNADLLAFVTNEESKISLTADYAKERNIVLEAYSDKIKPIASGMSQAEIDGIREAEKARDEALSKVEDWYTNELQIIFSNEEQKRKSYTETELVIKKGQEDLNTLKIQFEAAELQRNIDKNKELEKADEEHKKVLKKLEDDSNNALLDSFNRLKDAMKAGYQELAYAAYRAYQEGIINLDEYRKAVESVMNLRRMLGIPDSVPFVNSNNGGYTPSTNDSNYTPEEHAYATGTEYVDKFNKFPNGIDTVKAKLTKGEGVLDAALNKKRLDAGLDRFKTIEYAINYKSILDGGLQPLKIKESALNKLDEHAAMQYLLNFNMRPVVDKLESVEKALKSIPIQNFNLDEKGLSKYVETKNNVTKFKSKRLK
ncbi:MAG TPA: tape measure protein [Bacteroidia bacterium]|nr:tape measure protein [Bacteroidia bacterium]